MPGRNASSGDYRYGFNGKENDDEVKGVTGSQQDYGMRIYDPRLGRFLSVDPLTKEFPWYTPYQFAGNKPIWAIDQDGLEEFFRTNYYDMNCNLIKTEVTMVSQKGVKKGQQTVHHTNVEQQSDGSWLKVYAGTTTGTTTGDNAFSSSAERAVRNDNNGSTLSQNLRRKVLNVDVNGDPEIKHKGSHQVPLTDIVADENDNSLTRNTREVTVNGQRLAPIQSNGGREVGYSLELYSGDEMIGYDKASNGRKSVYNTGPQTFNNNNTPDAGFTNAPIGVKVPSNVNAVPKGTWGARKGKGGSGSNIISD